MQTPAEIFTAIKQVEMLEPDFLLHVLERMSTAAKYLMVRYMLDEIYALKGKATDTEIHQWLDGKK